METPRHLDVARTQSLAGRMLGAATQVDTSSRWAIAFILVGWFFIDTLTVSLGSLQHGIRFFDIAAVIADPTRMFFGVESSVQRVLFGLVCLACLLAPLAAHLSRSRFASFGYLAPLLLIAICGALLYSKSSSEFISAPSDANSVSSDLIRLANRLLRQGSGLAAKHVAVGVGGYVALIGSLVLAAQGVRRFHRQRRTPAEV
jgi:hypothetical protein